MPRYYKISSDEPLPDEEISLLEAHHNFIELERRAIDYRVLDDSSRIGAAELIGRYRSSQEDNLSFMSDLDKWHHNVTDQSPILLAKKMWLAVKHLGLAWQYESHSSTFNSGTTFNATLVDGDNLVTATLGDTMSYIAIFDNVTKECIGVRRLNQHYHQPNLSSEEERIQRAGGLVLRGRVQGILAVSRAIGDLSLRPYVIDSPTVEINSIKAIMQDFGISADADVDVKLITACDGLTDVAKSKLFKKNATDKSSDETFIKTYLEKNGDAKNLSPDKLAENLASEALRLGSKDNVSVIVQDITLKNLDKTRGFQGVYDGHGGLEASKFVARRMNAMLISMLNLDEQKVEEDLAAFNMPVEIVDHTQKQVAPIKLVSPVPQNIFTKSDIRQLFESKSDDDTLTILQNDDAKLPSNKGYDNLIALETMKTGKDIQPPLPNDSDTKYIETTEPMMSTVSHLPETEAVSLWQHIKNWCANLLKSIWAACQKWVALFIPEDKNHFSQTANTSVQEAPLLLQSSPQSHEHSLEIGGASSISMLDEPSAPTTVFHR